MDESYHTANNHYITMQQRNESADKDMN